MAIPETIARQATAIAESYNADITRIRNNGDLSQEGRVKALAKVWVTADAEMTKLREQYDGQTVTRREDLTQTVFGADATSGSDAISARDADDRAAQLDTAANGLALLERAEVNKDEVLAQAIARRAYTEVTSPLGFGSEWTAVLDAYVTRRPAVAAKIEELAAAERFTIQDSFRLAGLFFLVKPDELERMSATSILAYAGS
jgi:hypothetical protein